MNAAFAARFPFEVFDSIGDIDFPTRNSRFFQGGIQQCSGGADERPASLIFPITRLLSDEHDRRVGALTEDGLCTELPEIARFAAGGGFSEFGQRRFGRDKGGCGGL